MFSVYDMWREWSVYLQLYDVCRISERQSTEVAADSAVKVTPEKTVPSNQRPARGRPRKVLDSLVCCGVYEKFVVMHQYINTTQMFKNALFLYCLPVYL